MPAGEPYNPLLTRKRLLGGTEETTPGTMATVTAAFAANITDIKIEPVDFFADGVRMPDGQYLGEIAAVAGKKLGKLSYKEELAFGGPFLLTLTGAGMKLTSSTYGPTSNMTNRKTWSFKVWEDGRVKALAGCCGTFTLEVSRAGRVFANWEWSGVWQTVIDTAMPSQPTFPTLPYTAHSATLTVNATVVPYTESVKIDAGASVEERGSITSASGVAHFVVCERSPKISLDCEARLVAQRDVFGLLLSGASAAFSFALTDKGSAGSLHTMTIAAPAIQRRTVGHADRNKFLVDAEEFVCCASSGDDEITFTEATS